MRPPTASAQWLFVLGLAAACLCASPPANAAWVWSPETGWIGPSGPVKETPEEQLIYALAFFDQKDYESAKRELKKLLKAFPRARQAAEAQYYLGRSEEAGRDHYAAFQAYRKTIQKYPSTDRFEEIQRRELDIGRKFLAGAKRKLLGAASILPARDKAIEIFQAVADDAPFTEWGQQAQYHLGEAHLALGNYEEAVTAFEEIISRYPESPLVDDARYQIAMASLKGVFRSGYDQSPTDLAIEELDAFVKSYPQSELVDEARQRLTKLREQRAEHAFGVAEFYEGRRHPESARIYYREIVASFPDTSWATKAAARLKALGAAS